MSKVMALGRMIYQPIVKDYQGDYVTYVEKKVRDVMEQIDKTFIATSSDTTLKQFEVYLEVIIGNAYLEGMDAEHRKR